MARERRTREEWWRDVRRHAPSWALSLGLHAAILGPLCLITWAVTVAARPEPVLTLADRAAAGPEDDVAGDGEVGDDVLGKAGGAAGGGNDRFAVGAKNDAFSMPPKGTPPGAAEWTALTGDPGGGVPGLESQQIGSPFGSGDAAGPLIRNLTGKSVGIAGGGGLGSRGDLLYGTGTGFNEAIGALRGKGLDLVLVLDATDSMTPYIKQAKQRLGEVLNVVTTLVPTVRIGIVAYKDYGDDYGPTAVKYLRITSDSNAVRAFLNDIVAGGGGDEPEPINEALKVATDAKAMGWNMARKRVIVLVGDSTCHPSGRQEAFRLAKGFADGKGTINVIDPGGSGEQTARRAQVQPDLRRVAKDGGGEAFLLVEETEFWRHLIVSVFGRRFEADVDMIIQRVAKKE